MKMMAKNNFMTRQGLAIKYAFSWIGTPYLWGGDDFSGMDCSGFVQEILMSVGLDFPGDQTADGLYRRSEEWPEVMTAGSLAFFGKEKKITHVGFLVAPTIMIEAGGGNSQSKSAEIAAKQNAFVRMRPIYNRNDFIVARNPFESLK